MAVSPGRKRQRKAAIRRTLLPFNHQSHYRRSVYAALEDAAAIRITERQLADLHGPSLAWSRKANQLAAIGGYVLP